MQYGLAQAIIAAGGTVRLADKLGVSRRTISYWRRSGIPLERVVDVENATGVRRELLRPDCYPPAMQLGGRP